MDQVLLLSLLDFTELLLSNREKIENARGRNPTISNGVIEMEFCTNFGLCSNFVDFSHVSESECYNIPKELFESWDKYSGVSWYPVGDAQDCATIYCCDVYDKYDESVYGQSRWDLIIHLNNQCKLMLEKENV